MMDCHAPPPALVAVAPIAAPSTALSNNEAAAHTEEHCAMAVECFTARGPSAACPTAETERSDAADNNQTHESETLRLGLGVAPLAPPAASSSVAGATMMATAASGRGEEGSASVSVAAGPAELERMLAAVMEKRRAEHLAEIAQLEERHAIELARAKALHAEALAAELASNSVQ